MHVNLFICADPAYRYGKSIQLYEIKLADKNGGEIVKKKLFESGGIAVLADELFATESSFRRNIPIHVWNVARLPQVERQAGPGSTLEPGERSEEAPYRCLQVADKRLMTSPDTTVEVIDLQVKWY